MQAYDSIFVQDSMTKGPNSPEAKRHRGGRSPTVADEEMTERDQLTIPSMRGASGQQGDRNSAPRATPARRITALSPEALTQGFLLHEEQLALLQHQVSIVFKFPETAHMARGLMKAVREWQAEHTRQAAGTSHPWGSCSHYTAAALLRDLSKVEAPPKGFCTADSKYFQKFVQELGPDPHESLVHMVSYCSECQEGSCYPGLPPSPQHNLGSAVGVHLQPSRRL